MRDFKGTILRGAAIAGFAAAMGASGGAAAAPPQPCTAANYGEVSTIETTTPNGYVIRIYECGPTGWSLIGRCTQSGCIYY